MDIMADIFYHLDGSFHLVENDLKSNKKTKIMLYTDLNPDSLPEMFKQFKESIGGEIKEKKGLITLNVDNQIGKGTIKGINLKGGISYLDFDFTLYESLTINAETPKTSPIYFAYCTKGWLTHGFGNSAYAEKKLDCFQTGIIANSDGLANIIKFQENVALKTVLIVVNTTGPKSSEQLDLNAKLKDVFLKDINDPYFYVGSYNLKIADVIREMDDLAEKGIIRNLLIEGYVNMILGLELQQHKSDLSLKNQNLGSLTVRDMKSIQEISDFVADNLEKRLTIKMLCTRAGMSPRKLQEGFKLMHDTTVTDHVRDVRLAKAEELLKNTDLNVSEVVYSIGITSRSYFSKIFKNKYGVCPKDYKNQENTVAATA